jgi:lambda family phage portal protein
MAKSSKQHLNAIERAILAIAPTWALSRAKARTLAARHYEAAQIGRRTSGWGTSRTDANAAVAGGQLSKLRDVSRDLIRNNAWARRGLRVIRNHTVGWGIVPKPTAGDVKKIEALWKRWAETTECDADNRLTFYGLQRQISMTVAEAGEVIVRRRFRQTRDGLAVPLQFQVLEPDFIDTTKDRIPGETGGLTIHGKEYDPIGRCTAYWLYDTHPGSSYSTPVSHRVPADGVLHIFDQERPGQVRGIPWFVAALLRLKDLDEYEDATLMKQKIAACLTGFVTDAEGTGAALGEEGEDASTGDPLDMLEPGLIATLPPGKQVTFTNPPSVTDHGTFTTGELRAVAAAIGVTYEDLSGDYSQVNYSSSRMARLEHWNNVHDWRWNMLIPQFCVPAWGWMLYAMSLSGVNVGANVAAGDPTPPAVWTPPPMQMIDPEKEGLALGRLVRVGAMTPDQMVREQGEDPEAHWQEYADSLERLDKLGIVLDSDPRKTTATGQAQGTAAGDANAEGAVPLAAVPADDKRPPKPKTLKPKAG